jgi:hypothetical protein
MSGSETQPTTECPGCGVRATGKFCHQCGTELTSRQRGPLRSLLESILNLERFRRYGLRYLNILRAPTMRILALSTELTQVQSHQFLGVGIALYALFMIPWLASFSGSVQSFILPSSYFTVAIVVYCLVLYRLGTRATQARRTLPDFLTTASLVLGFNLPLVAVLQRTILAINPPEHSSELGPALTWGIYLAVLIVGINVSLLPYNARIWAAFWQLRRGTALRFVFLSAVASAVAGTALLTAFGTFPPEQHPLARGDCVRLAGGDIIRTSCAAADARAFATGFDSDIGGVFGNPDCPEDTDFFKLISIRRLGCFRNLAPPHPGDTGEGGGIVRTGDCVSSGFVEGSEVQCRSRHVYARVTGRVDAVRDCPPKTVEFAELNTDSRPIACLGGREIIQVGDCLSRIFGIAKVPCRSSGVTHVVESRIRRTAKCPKATTSTDLEDTRLLWSPQASSTTRPIVCLRPAERSP